MSVKHALLGILVEKPRHGYDLKRAFEDKVGEFWSLNYGQIYTTLERLCADGLVEYEEISQDDRPDKKIYRVTSAGQQEFHEWRMSPVKAEPRMLRDELFLKLMFIREEDFESVLQTIQSQQSVYMAHMMQLTDRKFQTEQAARRAMQQADDPVERQNIERDKVIKTLLIDVALQHAEADIRWLRHCEAKMKDLFRR